jgi:uncharacterized UBP type Zn finger protein
MPARPPPCEHLAGIASVTPRSATCEACAALGARWNELRVCLACGHVGCCEDSPHAHALAHFRETGHPVIASLDRRERWTWCYVHARYGDLPESVRPGPRPGLSGFLDRILRR